MLRLSLSLTSTQYAPAHPAGTGLGRTQQISTPRQIRLEAALLPLTVSSAHTAVLQNLQSKWGFHQNERRVFVPVRGSGFYDTYIFIFFYEPYRFGRRTTDQGTTTVALLLCRILIFACTSIVVRCGTREERRSTFCMSMPMLLLFSH